MEVDLAYQYRSGATVAKYDAKLEFEFATEDRAADVDKLRARYEAEKYNECTFKPDLPKPYIVAVH